MGSPCEWPSRSSRRSSSERAGPSARPGDRRPQRWMRVVTSQGLPKQECAVAPREKSCSRAGDDSPLTAMPCRRGVPPRPQPVAAARFPRGNLVGTAARRRRWIGVGGERRQWVRCGSFSPSSDPPSPAQVSLRSQRSQVRILPRVLAFPLPRTISKPSRPGGACSASGHGVTATLMTPSSWFEKSE